MGREVGKIWEMLGEGINMIKIYCMITFLIKRDQTTFNHCPTKTGGTMVQHINPCCEKGGPDFEPPRQLNGVIHLCNSSILTVRWEAEMGRSPEACGPDSLFYATINNKQTLSQIRRQERIHTQSCSLISISML